MKRLLVATSLDPKGTALVSSGVALSRFLGGQVAVAHVDGGDDSRVGDPHGRRASVASRLREHIDGSGDGESVTEAVLLRGEVVKEIVAYATRHRFDLLLVGGSAPGESERLNPGSTAQALVRSAPCPVLCVDLSRPLHQSFRSIVLAAELEPRGRSTAFLAAELGLGVGTSLTAVFASGHLAGSSYGLSRAEALSKVVQEEARLDELRRQLSAFVRDRGGDPLAVHSRRVDATDVAQGVLRAAVDARADLIVCGMCTRESFGPPDIGSVCEQLLRRASCSVLVARRSTTGED